MGSVPSDFTLEHIIGRQLNQICIGPYDLQFHFDSVRSICCSGTVLVEVGAEKTRVFQGAEPYWLDVTPLPRLVGQVAASWKIEGSHEFSLTLSGGAKFRFQSTDCPYEEFLIRDHARPDVFQIV